jgi:hypothetical protein
MTNHLAGDIRRKQITVEKAAIAGAGDRAIGADEGHAEAERLSHRQRKIVTPAGNERDFNAAFVGAEQRLQVRGRNLKARIQQSSIDIDGDEPNRMHSLRFYTPAARPPTTSNTTSVYIVAPGGAYDPAAVFQQAIRCLHC